MKLNKLKSYISSQNNTQDDFDYGDYLFSNKTYSKAQLYFAGDISNSRCLDVGGSDGTLAMLLREYNNDVSIIDLSDSALRIAGQRGFEALKIDLSEQRYPFENETFDNIFCIEVLEHLKNPDFCISEILRLLKQNGKLIISTPNNLKEVTDKHHVNAWNYKNFGNYLENSGFEKIDEGGYWYIKGTGLLRIHPKILFYIGTKFPNIAKYWTVKLKKK